MAEVSRLNISELPLGSAICKGCGDTFPIKQLIQPGCGEHYCKICFIDFFGYQASSLPEFPPECCGIILYPHDYLSILPDDMIRDWIRVSKIDRETTRTACATPQCHGPGIDPITIHNDWGLCERCHQLTCTRCGQLQPAHIQPTELRTAETNIQGNADEDVSTTTTTNTTTPADDSILPVTIQQASARTRACPPQPIDHAFEELACKNGWKRCPACNVPIERTDGCPEMICMCGEVFCYDCGKAREQGREHGCMCHY